MWNTLWLNIELDHFNVTFYVMCCKYGIIDVWRPRNYDTNLSHMSHVLIPGKTRDFYLLGVKSFKLSYF